MEGRPERLFQEPSTPTLCSHGSLSVSNHTKSFCMCSLTSSGVSACYSPSETLASSWLRSFDFFLIGLHPTVPSLPEFVSYVSNTDEDIYVFPQSQNLL